MTATAQVACYIQPITDTALLVAGGIARSDTAETAVVRGTARSEAEALEIINRARQVARALGRPAVIKKAVSRWGSDRLPRGVKALAGTEAVNVL